eukprot:c13773_g1_i1.p1 GENE.c13773_g1_i1~~c13773_g1_i1.p1  ORF type:complete len:584 (-),score=185.95 c13773_g1_i1:27-1541(-)
MAYDVVITTYNIVSQEYSPEEGGAGKRKRKSHGLLFKCRWFRIVLDEGHCIKNSSTVCARSCHALLADRRWVLTGTPVQNSVKDLFSIFCFLKLKPYDCPHEFRILASNMDLLKAQLCIVMKRRTKESKLKGKLVLQLPTKTIEDIYCEFSNTEREFYDRLSTQATKTLEKISKDGSMKQYTNILSMLMKLRIACNHPYLATKQSETSSNASQIASQYGVPEHVIISALEADALEVECCHGCGKSSQDKTGKGLLLVPCGHVYCMGCLESEMSACVVCSRDLIEYENGELQLLSWEMPQIKSLFQSIRQTSTGEDFGFGPKHLSTKFKYLLNFLVEENRGRKAKTVVFSQWVCTLDLLNPVLRQHQFIVFQIDGRLPMFQRTREIERFKDYDGFAVMLMSLHTGSLGLNLTFAANIVLMDSWWNPAIEAQAIDRVHRIGQTKPVFVKKLIVKNSVEDQVIEIQKRKLREIQEAYSGNKYHQTLSKFSVDELRSLFAGVGKTPRA